MLKRLPGVVLFAPATPTHTILYPIQLLIETRLNNLLDFEFRVSVFDVRLIIFDIVSIDNF